MGVLGSWCRQGASRVREEQRRLSSPALLRMGRPVTPVVWQQGRINS